MVRGRQDVAMLISSGLSRRTGWIDVLRSQDSMRILMQVVTSEVDRVQILTGQNNYLPLLRDFRLSAEHKGVWDLSEGTVEILTKLIRADYL